MSDEAPPLDRAALLGSLERNGVRFVLVGGLAAQVYGAKRVTNDADICPEWSDANLTRLAASLNELGARLKIGEGSIDVLEIAIERSHHPRPRDRCLAHDCRRPRRAPRDPA